MVRHSMKIPASSAVLSKKHWPKKCFMLFEEKAILVLLRIKKEKKFCNPCALFKETFFVLKLLLTVQPELALLAQPTCLPCSVLDVPLCLESFAIFCIGVKSVMPAVLAREAWREGLRVLAPLHPSVCGIRRDHCRLGRQMVALGLLGQSWCGCRELWTKCFSSVPRRCAGTRWDGDTVCKSILGISALIAAYCYLLTLIIAFCMLVWGAANAVGSPSRQVCLCRVHLGRKSWESWRCDGLKSS